MKKILSLIFISILSFSMVACSASKNSASIEASNDFKGTGGYYSESIVNGFSPDVDAYMETTQSTSSINNNETIKDNKIATDTLFVEEKLIYTCNLNIETTEYKEVTTGIINSIKSFNGFIQTQEENDYDYGWYNTNHVKRSGTKHMYLTIRIPSKDYFNFINAVEECNGKIVNKEQKVDNISQKYYDTKTDIASLEIQEERLLNMLKDATTIEDMITIEARLSEVQNKLNKLQTELIYMDMDVAYSYVNISIDEVLEYIEDEPQYKQSTFFNRLYKACANSIKSFLEFLENILFSVIYLIPYAIIVFIFVILIKKIKKKYKLKEKFQRKKKNNLEIEENISTEKDKI